jgi:F0F1-type ATP synthase epsilon subunit
MFLDVAILTPTEVIFEGKVSNITLPGESGVFEVLPFHKCRLSRLISGTLVVNEEVIYIKRGVVKADRNKVVVIIEKE